MRLALVAGIFLTSVTGGGSAIEVKLTVSVVLVERG